MNNDGLTELLSCGAVIYPVAHFDAAAFFNALSGPAQDTYNYIGKWWFTERKGKIIFTDRGMDIFRRSGIKNPDVVIPFLARLVDTIKSDPLHNHLHEMIHITKHAFTYFGDDQEGGLAQILGDIWTLPCAVPDKHLLEESDHSFYRDKEYTLFLANAETHAALTIFYRAIRMEDNTELQLELFRYAEQSFSMLEKFYQELCPEDYPLLAEITLMKNNSKRSLEKARKIQSLEKELSILEALQE